MKSLFLLALCCLSLPAQTLTFAIHDNTGATADVPLNGAYQFAATPQGSAVSVLVEVTNNSPNRVEVALVYVGATAGSTIKAPDFSVTGFGQGQTLATKGSLPFMLNFTPSAPGQLFGHLQVAYIVEQGGCKLDSKPPATPCSGATAPVATLEGTGTTPQYLLTYNNGQGSIQPAVTSLIDFGNVATSLTSRIVFTLANQTSSPIATPAVSILSDAYISSAFSLDTSALPAALPPNGSATFRVTFAPGQGLFYNGTLLSASLVVASASYRIQGFGTSVEGTLDSLAISYVDSTGVRPLPQAATAIDFGQIVPGTGSTLKFTVMNPATPSPTVDNAVNLPILSVSGAAFSLTGAPALPVTIQPNASVTFSVTFSASASANYSGNLTIGNRTFSLTGLGVVSPLPALSLQLSQQPLTSAQQVNLTVQAASAATQDVPGTLTMQFTPSVSNVKDDPAIVFLATNSRTLSLDLAKGAQSATYKGQSALTFQTGTTAGTITFTLTFVNTPPITQTFTITPALIHISGGQAIRQSPNLVVTMNGFDNTYTAGQLSFTFFDTKGAQINATAMPVDASSDFHQYFFSNDLAGGSFALQASFPVKGDPTQIGSVAVTMTNSAGQSSTKLAFQ